ncbi:MAG: sigma-70 family RNA polymerase sigma factor [Clostridia bacterium]|nr:sigma-70 family RNA polymerase sigma factor [Clostridia bacterium]
MRLCEQELVRLCQKGDHEAFNQLVQLYQSKVINIAYGLLSNTEDAADAAQDTFIKIYRSISSFKGKSSLSTWIYRITVNVCTDILRKRGKQNIFSINTHTEDDEREFDIKDPSHTPDELAEITEMQKEIRSAIASLPHDYKIVVVLYDIEGLSYNEISQILSCPIGTVKSRLNRGRTLLKNALAEPFSKRSV